MNALLAPTLTIAELRRIVVSDHRRGCLVCYGEGPCGPCDKSERVGKALSAALDVVEALEDAGTNGDAARSPDAELDAFFQWVDVAYPEELRAMARGAETLTELP